ncbi:hypothetical protein [Nostoc sp.]|uniref:hypothetical protein n=1 Tax=Nostoc sp. TaxID=1180 RepID=UPI002FF7D193
MSCDAEQFALLYETLLLAYFHVRASVFVGAASPSGEGELVRHGSTALTSRSVTIVNIASTKV